MQQPDPAEKFQEIVENNRSRMEPPKVKDPVCGMDVVSGDSDGGNATYDGETYDFCSSECRERFQANPSAYVARH